MFGVVIMMFGGIVCGVFGVSVVGKLLEDIVDLFLFVEFVEKGVIFDGRFVF